MPYEEDNVFARVLRGEIPVERVYEDEYVLAFHDINPQAPVHVVVVTKASYGSFDELTTEGQPEELASFTRSLGEVARRLKLPSTGYRVVINHGEHAQPGFQHEIPHAHAHLLAGRSLGPLLGLNRGFDEMAPTPTEDDLTLVLLPGESEATPEQVEGLRDLLELDAYEISRMFPTPLPRFLRWGPAPEVRALALALEGRSVPVRALTSSDVLGEFHPWVITSVETAESGLLLKGDEGSFHLSPEARGFVVRGRYTWLTTVQEGARVVMFTSNRRRGSTTRLAKPKRTPFAHFYLDGEPRPFSMVASEISDFTFLGEAMTASAHGNFEKLVALVLECGSYETDERLLRHPLLVKTTGEQFWSGTQPLKTTSPDATADVLSRLLFELRSAD